MHNPALNEAIGQALAEEMRRGPGVAMFGKGVVPKGLEIVRVFGIVQCKAVRAAAVVLLGLPLISFSLAADPLPDPQ